MRALSRIAGVGMGDRQDLPGRRRHRMAQHYGAGAKAVNEAPPKRDTQQDPAVGGGWRMTERKRALAGVRICDFTGQLAGAGATKWLAAFGADVIRIEDPVNQGAWDILRTMPPFVDKRRGPDFGGGFNNHNTEKRGITLNLRTQRGKQPLAALVQRSDVVTENFAAGVLERWGFGYAALRALKPDIIYVSNCGFGHVGPYAKFKTWGPIVQAIS